MREHTDPDASGRSARACKADADTALRVHGEFVVEVCAEHGRVIAADLNAWRMRVGLGTQDVVIYRAGPSG